MVCYEYDEYQSILIIDQKLNCMKHSTQTFLRKYAVKGNLIELSLVGTQFSAFAVGKTQCQITKHQSIVP